MIFKLSEPYNIDTTAKIECLDTEGLNGMVTKVLDKNGVDKEDIVVSSDWTVELFGTVCALLF